MERSCGEGLLVPVTKLGRGKSRFIPVRDEGSAAEQARLRERFAGTTPLGLEIIRKLLYGLAKRVAAERAMQKQSQITGHATESPVV